VLCKTLSTLDRPLSPVALALALANLVAPVVAWGLRGLRIG